MNVSVNNSKPNVSKPTLNHTDAEYWVNVERFQKHANARGTGPTPGSNDVSTRIETSIGGDGRGVSGRAGWRNDVGRSFTALQTPVTNARAMIAVAAYCIA
jgi:hypothetical protein